MGLITTHYFDADGQLLTYEEERNDAGEVVFTSGVRPPASARIASPDDVAAHFTRMVDAQRQAHASMSVEAETRFSARVALTETRRASLAAVGLDESIQDALFPLPGDFVPVPYSEPVDQLREVMRGYGLSEDQVTVVLQRRGV